MLTLAISPCPNDTFIFASMAPRYRLTLDDVEALNERAERGEFDVTKISIAAYPRIRHEYALLRAGGAAGFGVGPLVVARQAGPIAGPVAIPGERTTAARLLALLGRFETRAMRFDEIEDAVLGGRVAAGVLIHEGRFTYAAKGLVCLADLGDVWERTMRCPLPLGAIAIRRRLGEDAARRVDHEIRHSLRAARAAPDEVAGFVAQHAQEMAPDVIRRHIDLYVNDYTLDLDEAAVMRFLALDDPAAGDPGRPAVFAYSTENRTAPAPRP
jgi:1,4-dihydroxy-6-naphthoate synthase